MVRMNLFMKHYQTHAHRYLWLPSGMGLGEGRIGNLGLADMSVIHRMDQPQGSAV